ncbi:hypothetical protein G6F56_002625 [Rhizopus delemar]|nr:hypothetical protein G6F56_002625 [Rhizopus delemar]
MSIQNSLGKVFESPREYLADVCFCFPSIDIWAHRAILLARAPKEFLKRLIPKIFEDSQLPLKLDISHLIQQELLSSCLCFWYTDSFRLPESDELIKCNPELGSDFIPDYNQWVIDFRRMLVHNTAADVTIQIISSDNNTISTTTSFKAHKFILAAQSAYFYSLFCTQFKEASDSTIHLTDDLFNTDILRILLDFFYTQQIVLPDTTFNDLLEKKKYHLSILQKSFYASDYLGHGETLCNALLSEMQCVCHQFKCHCPDCAVLLPSMLAWTEKQSQVKFRKILVSLYSNPVHSISTLWSQRSFSLLVGSLVSSTSALAQDALRTTLRREPVCQGPLIEEIEKRAFANVNRHNAVQVMQSLYLCLCHIRSTDPTPTWSRPGLDLLEPLLDYTAQMVSQHFGFYCVEYPILPCCVDSTGFSSDFLDFLLRQVLKHMQEIHAGVIYQSITRDLARRHEALRNAAVSEILMIAKYRCADYISQHWITLKAHGEFNNLDKNVLQQLSEEIGVPYRELAYQRKKPTRRWSIEPLVHTVRPRHRQSFKNISAQIPIHEPALRTYASFDSLPDKLLFLDPLMKVEHQKPVIPLPPASSRRLSKYLTLLFPKRKRIWASNKSSESDDETVHTPYIGDKVEVLNRPLRTFGTIRYVGPVQFTEGLCIGVELENRLGKSDGSIDGVRYFHTDPQRALFVQLEDLRILYHQS